MHKWLYGITYLSLNYLCSFSQSIIWILTSLVQVSAYEI